MKLLLLLLCFSTGVVNNITLTWDYPVEELSDTMIFKIYHSTSITTPLTNWSVIATIPGTITNCVIPIQPGVHFYTATASNQFGESLFSNIATGQVARGVNVKIKPGP